jgi:site-specific DNA-methyltransferase (adenine-specific)
MIVHVLRKPVVGTVAQNALAHGCGALNIDGCRVGYQSDADKTSATPQGTCTAKSGALAGGIQNGNDRTEFDRPELKGRWPANLVHDGSDKVLETFPAEAGNGWGKNYGTEVYAVENRQYSGGSFGGGGFLGNSTYADTGGASRFFQQVKVK